MRSETAVTRQIGTLARNVGVERPKQRTRAACRRTIRCVLAFAARLVAEAAGR